MALVKPLYAGTDGFPVETSPSADSIALGGLNMNGDIVMSGNEITGLPTTPSASAAASKEYVDAVANGLQWKDAVRVATAAALPAYTAAGSGIGKTLTANAVGVLTIDGVATVLGDRILVKNEGASHVDHGPYEVTTEGTAGVAFVLTRVADADESSEVTAGLAVFVDQGSTQADTHWVLTTNDPITVDTTALAFAQFGGPGSFTGGDGIDIIGSVISVDLSATPGLEFSAGLLQTLVNPAGAIERVAAGIGVILESANPSLQISANELGVKLDAARAITKNASGIGVDVETTNPSLQISANELGIKFNPAGALEKLAAGTGVRVDGSTITINGSNQLQANEASRAENEALNAGTGGVATGDPVYTSAANTGLPADAASATARSTIGIAAAAATAGNPIRLVTSGLLPGVLVGATFNDPVWLANGTGLTTTIPSVSGDHRIYMGRAINATDMVMYGPVYQGRVA